MTDRDAPTHADVFAAFGADDAGIVIAAQPGFGQRRRAQPVSTARADRLAWLRAALLAAGHLGRRRPQRGVHR